jgi:hypothetical protein
MRPVGVVLSLLGLAFAYFAASGIWDAQHMVRNLPLADRELWVHHWRVTSALVLTIALVLALSGALLTLRRRVGLLVL